MKVAGELGRVRELGASWWWWFVGAMLALPVWPLLYLNLANQAQKHRASSEVVSEVEDVAVFIAVVQVCCWAWAFVHVFRRRRSAVVKELFAATWASAAIPFVLRFIAFVITGQVWLVLDILSFALVVLTFYWRQFRRQRSAPPHQRYEPR